MAYTTLELTEVGSLLPYPLLLLLLLLLCLVSSHSPQWNATSALVNTRRQINSAYRSVNPFCISLCFLCSLFFALFFNALLVFYDSLFTATAAAAATPSPTPFAAAPSSTASSLAAYKVHLARLLFPAPALLSTPWLPLLVLLLMLSLCCAVFPLPFSS